MKKRKRRADYLSYIEEKGNRLDLLDELAKNATGAAFETAKQKKLPVTYAEGGSIIRESNGVKEIIGVVCEPSVKIKKGAIIQLH